MQGCGKWAAIMEKYCMLFQPRMSSESASPLDTRMMVLSCLSSMLIAMSHVPDMTMGFLLASLILYVDFWFDF